MATATIMEYDITVIVTAHAEGRLAHRTMRSIEAAIKHAQGFGLLSEIIVVLDNPTFETLDYFARWRDKARVVEVNNRDPGLNRNHGVSLALGKYVAIIDADDLIGNIWLYAAYQFAEQVTLPVFALHSEIINYFENRLELSRHISSNSHGWHKSLAYGSSLWTSILFASRNTFLTTPFVATPIDSGFGYEDWHWMCEVLAKGGEILIVPETCNFVRYKAHGSRLVFHSHGRALLRPTQLFDPRTFLDNQRTTSPRLLTIDSKPAELKQQSISDSPRWYKDLAQRISKATESYPPLQKALGAVYRLCVGYEKGIARESLLSAVLAQWQAMAVIEPQLAPSDSYLEQVNWFSREPDQLGAAYEALCRLVSDCHLDIDGPQFTHIYLLPWLKTGGADLEAINYISLVASNSAHRVLVIATEGSISPWTSRLPSAVHFIDIGKITQSLRRPKRVHLLAQFLIQLQSDVIHLINSDLGSQAFETYGNSLSRVSRLYAQTFCTEIDAEGTQVGFPIMYVPKYARHLQALLADNRAILEYLQETFAIDPAKAFVHYQPMVLRPLPAPAVSCSGKQFHILWAGRLNRQKRPDLLLSIAQRCLAENMHFHVYGTAGISWDKVEVNFEGIPNLTDHGAYDGFESLPAQEYNVFLNTSQWEGMPNILLEAVAAGLPVVTSNVGGISELIVNDETGMLVTPFDDVEQYVAALRRLMDQPSLGKQLVEASRALVEDRHSSEHFESDVRRLPGYMHPNCPVIQQERPNAK